MSEEVNQKYSNLCVLIGDNFLKMKHHEGIFKQLVTEANELITKSQGELNVKESKTSPT